jgi:hypothetical protein
MPEKMGPCHVTRSELHGLGNDSIQWISECTQQQGMRMTVQASPVIYITYQRKEDRKMRFRANNPDRQVWTLQGCAHFNILVPLQSATAQCMRHVKSKQYAAKAMHIHANLQE